MTQRTLFHALGVFIIFTCALVALMAWPEERTRLRLVHLPSGDQLLVTEADSPMTRAKGLSGIDVMTGDGMLLAWRDPDVHPIWMHDMQFPIDAIWCDHTGMILGIHRNLTPCSNPLVCPLYGQEYPYTSYVLELPAHGAAQYELRPGDRLLFSDLPGGAR